MSRDISPLTELNAQDGFGHYEERANNRTVGLLRPALHLNSAYLERANTKGYKTKRQSVIRPTLQINCSVVTATP